MMFRKVATAIPLKDMELLVWFAGGETKRYAVAPLLERWPAFEALADERTFAGVRVDPGGYGVSWNDEVDLSADELYANGVAVEVSGEALDHLICEILRSRREKGFTQASLEEASGVRQPVIARMEGGDTSPRIDTVLRVLAPLGKTLAVVDLPEALEA